MAGVNKRTSRKQPSGLRTAVIILMVLAAVALLGYLFHFYLKAKQPPFPTESGITAPGNIPAVHPPKPSFAESSAVHIPLPEHHTEYPEHVPPMREPKRSEPVRPHGASARLAIIIDDMGSSVSEARSLAAIKVPVTFSIIPGLRFDREVAEYAATHHIEQMIHIPMQPKGWPTQRLEANGLLISMSDGEIRERVAGFVNRFPAAVGANNHMGSEFTEHEQRMAVALEVLKSGNLYFVDSVTSPQSTGFGVAERTGMRTARRNTFLDNKQERGYITGQIDQAINYARKHGSAIAICHPHPVTISTLAAVLPKLAAQGIQLVPASQLVR